MPNVVHVVTTRNFAGVEKYVCDVANETAARGWKVTVVGGSGSSVRARLDGRVRWLPGATPTSALRSLARVGRQDVCHAHMTVAETVALVARPRHRARVVSTRHFAAHRGSSKAARLLAPWIASGLAREIAVSEFVARRVERRPDAVIPNGVPSSALFWSGSNRTVLMLQRLEREKDTITALRAWQASGLVDEGWCLRLVGNGSERTILETVSASEGIAGVTFAGWKPDVTGELATAGLLLAPAPAEPFGLAVVEAMAAGIPVVACGAGGHLETAGLVPNAALFPPGDVAAAAAALRSLLPEATRARASDEGRRLVDERFTIGGHVDRLLEQYDVARAGTVAAGRLGIAKNAAP